MKLILIFSAINSFPWLDITSAYLSLSINIFYNYKINLVKNSYYFIIIKSIDVSLH